MAALRNSLAASALRQHFSKTASQTNIHNMPTEDGDLNGRADPNERTGLLSRMTTTDSGTPFYKHDNALIKYPFLVLHLTWEILKTNYVNVLLVFVPIGILAGILDWSPTLQFVFNFIAIIPLAALLAFATEELAVPLGQTIGGLLNATFGNAVELIVSSGATHFSKIVTNRKSGEHHRPAEERNSHCSGKHARQYLVQHPPRLGLLFPGGRHQIPRTKLQLDCRFHHVFPHDGRNLVADHPGHLVRRHEQQ
jgi:hypothetical protein